MSLDSLALVLEEYGPVAPTLFVAPVHYPEVRNTDGLGLEEATTNLITNPAPTSSAGYTGVNASAVGSPTTVGGVSGLLPITLASGAGNTVGVQLTGGVTIAASSTYTLSCEVFVPVGSPTMQISVQGAGVATAGSSTTGGVTGRLVPLTVTFTTTASATSANVALYLLNSTTATTGQLVYAKRFQLEQKSYRTSYADGSLGSGYAWTGTANASTSTRSGAALTHAASGTLKGPLTLSVFIRVGAPGSSGGGNVCMALGTSGSTTPFMQLFNGTTFGFGNNLDANSSAALTYAPGDLIFVAGTLSASGTVHTAYASKNGGALVAAASSTGTAHAGSTSVQIGILFSSFQVDGGLEQALIHNAVLTSAEIAALSTGSPVDYPDDTRIVYATGTKLTRGTTKALTAAGTGKFRTVRTLAANLDVLSDFTTGAYTFGTGATHRISVPAGSGIGVGQSLGFRPDSERWQVVNVFSPGGEYDECYCVQTA